MNGIVWQLIGAGIGIGVGLVLIGMLIVIDGFIFDVWGWRKHQ